MKAVNGLLILLICASAVRSRFDYLGTKTYYGSLSCGGSHVTLTKGRPLNVCIRHGSGSSYTTYSNLKKVTLDYASDDCDGTPTRSETDVSFECQDSVLGTHSFETVVISQEDLEKAKAEGLFRTIYLASDKCKIPSGYPTEVVFDASWNGKCVAMDSTNRKYEWTTKSFKITTYANEGCSGTSSVLERNLNECKNTSSTSSERWSTEDKLSAASPSSIAFNAMMLAFVVGITLLQ